MKYDFANTILYNDKGVYYQINSYANDRLSIGQIKKPPEDTGCRLTFRGFIRWKNEHYLRENKG